LGCPCMVEAVQCACHVPRGCSWWLLLWLPLSVACKSPPRTLVWVPWPAGWGGSPPPIFFPLVGGCLWPPGCVLYGHNWGFLGCLCFAAVWISVAFPCMPFGAIGSSQLSCHLQCPYLSIHLILHKDSKYMKEPCLPSVALTCALGLQTKMRHVCGHVSKQPRRVDRTYTFT
jgi:hypothetical protein